MNQEKSKTIKNNPDIPNNKSRNQFIIPNQAMNKVLNQ